MISEARALGNERRQFSRSVLPMTVTIEGREYKGHDLSLGGMCLFGIFRPFTENVMARVSINRRDVRIDFVVEAAPVKYEVEETLQSFRFLGLSKMQASVISLLMHPDEFGANGRPLPAAGHGLPS